MKKLLLFAIIYLHFLSGQENESTLSCANFYTAEKLKDLLVKEAYLYYGKKSVNQNVIALGGDTLEAQKEQTPWFRDIIGTILALESNKIHDLFTQSEMFCKFSLLGKRLVIISNGEYDAWFDESLFPNIFEYYDSSKR